MKISLLLLAILMALTACKRRAAPTTPTAPPPRSEPVQTPPAAKPAPAAVQGGASRVVASDQNLPALNSALKAYTAKHKQPPAKLDDLAKDGLIPFIPMAPPGMRYELDRTAGEVKLINPLAK